MDLGFLDPKKHLQFLHLQFLDPTIFGPKNCKEQNKKHLKISSLSRSSEPLAQEKLKIGIGYLRFPKITDSLTYRKIPYSSIIIKHKSRSCKSEEVREKQNLIIVILNMCSMWETQINKIPKSRWNPKINQISKSWSTQLIWENICSNRKFFGSVLCTVLLLLFGSEILHFSFKFNPICTGWGGANLPSS